MQNKSVFEIVQEMEQNDQSGTTNISEYVDFDMRETINRVEAYLNSKHISGDTDASGREKPFFNIVNSAVNIYYRATDIDRKHITVKATKQEDMLKSFLATILLQKFMRKSGFGTFLNEWGRILSRYGSAVVKFVEKGGELYPSVLPWSSVICDPIDFDNNVQIEKLWFTPAQLKENKSYDQEMVDRLIENTTTRKTDNGLNVDNKSGYIPVYEVHGILPLSELTDDEKDEETFVQQTHHISWLASKEKGEFDDYSLYSGRESKSPLMITHLIKEDGRALGIGAVEHLFDAQWMMNHSAKQIKDQLDLASKLFFQTSDGNFVGQNALNNLENGDILIHNNGQPLTQINNKPDIVAMQSNMQQWQAIGSQINGISESMQGDTAPSGTAWRQVEALLQESHSLFELMTENKGLALNDMMTTYIIPYLKKKMDTTEEISEILSSEQIKFIDTKYIPNETIRRVNDRKKKTILSGQIYTPEQEMADNIEVGGEVQGEIDSMGRQRFIAPSDIKSKTWKESLKDLEWELETDTTGEQKDRQSAMATLNTLFQTMANPAINQVLQTDQGKLVFNRILEMTGAVSPIEVSQMATPPVQQPQPIA